ncbi:hypothetical protein MKW92_004502 [Papaver armeniacum]|nr:hypothetical protein MKW92_004502 [Papaver armeniacum]
MNLYNFLSILLIQFVILVPKIYVECRNPVEVNSHYSKVHEFINNKKSQGTRWAVLIAGSNGFINYRHQADVCHAYQILKKGGLKDENIVVMMYDDIANNRANPRPGTIINNPHGEDVYHGVPKDYIGEDVNVGNFLNVLLGNRSALTGHGSGKVVSSGPNDTIFLYYSDHGGPGVLSMPMSKPLYADELNDALRKKHRLRTYKSMLIYIEACEAGSIFEGLLKPGMNIYATTASNATENSWSFYCPGDKPNLPAGYNICLGDLYSINWMEHSERYNMMTETLDKQYAVVRRRTETKGSIQGSNVIKYGDIKQLGNQSMYTYIGTYPGNCEHNSSLKTDREQFAIPSHHIDQRDTDLAYYQHQYQYAPMGSEKKTKAWQRYQNALQQRSYVDDSMDLIGKFLYGSNEMAANVMKALRPAGQSLVDDWSCYKTMVETYEKNCGPFSRHGLKHMRSLANMCNAGVKPENLAKASDYACSTLRKRPF